MAVLNQGAPFNLFGLESKYGEARIAVLPVPYEGTVSYMPGTRFGPRAIIDASRNIELYSDELKKDISKIGIFTLEEMLPNVSSPENMSNDVGREVEVILDDKKIPLLLGGEHSISIGAISAMAKRDKDFSVLHFDAHSDSRETFMGSRYSHACVMKRILEMRLDYCSVGVRSIDEGTDKESSSILFMKDMHKMKIEEITDTISRRLKERVYLTVDFDVIDPSEMPSVGTPEPDGMRFYEISQILKNVLKSKKLIGMDFVELSPIPGFVAPDFLAAKLIYNTIGYAFYQT
jgi:agmatinase